MCILGSREHACIHPVVSKSKRKNDECKKTLEVMSIFSQYSKYSIPRCNGEYKYSFNGESVNHDVMCVVF